MPDVYGEDSREVIHVSLPHLNRGPPSGGLARLRSALCRSTLRSLSGSRRAGSRGVGRGLCVSLQCAAHHVLGWGTLLTLDGGVLVGAASGAATSDNVIEAVTGGVESADVVGGVETIGDLEVLGRAGQLRAGAETAGGAGRSSHGSCYDELCGEEELDLIVLDVLGSFARRVVRGAVIAGPLSTTRRVVGS